MTTGLGMGMPSSRQEVEEDMLEELYDLSRTGSSVPASDLCRRMGMTKREVNLHLKEMVKSGCVKELKKTDEVMLTELGKNLGARCRQRHETFAQFLQFVGVSGETAVEDACRMEHVVSDETVRQICNFVNYGDTFERVLGHTDLKYRYSVGEYNFLMGIYYMEKICPRRMAREFQWFSENVVLHIGESDSYFVLKKVVEDRENLVLWYMDWENGWEKAVADGDTYRIPTRVFEFFIRQQDPLTEGTALIALLRKGEKPDEYRGRELDVHIW